MSAHVPMPFPFDQHHQIRHGNPCWEGRVLGDVIQPQYCPCPKGVGPSVPIFFINILINIDVHVEIWYNEIWHSDTHVCEPYF